MIGIKLRRELGCASVFGGDNQEHRGRASNSSLGSLSVVLRIQEPDLQSWFSISPPSRDFLAAPIPELQIPLTVEEDIADISVL